MVPVRLFARLLCLLSVISATVIPAAAWTVCNETSYIVRLAHATGENTALVAQGWTRIRPGECSEFDVEKGVPRFLFAESSTAYPGGIREWRGDVQLCAIEDSFTSDPSQSCALQNLDTRPYMAIDPDEERTALVEPRDFGQKAQTAGMQRLLSAAGYAISSVDGNSGRQTSRALRKFKQDTEIEGNPDEGALMDALEIAALERQNAVGIIICNRGTSRIWTAVGYRQDAGWESRGWWAVEPDACARPHTESIKGLDPHIFALKEQDDAEDLILKSNNAEPTPFCVAESRFSSTIRQNCADRGYRPINFRPVSDEAEGVQVNLTDTDFSAAKKGGLRR